MKALRVVIMLVVMMIGMVSSSSSSSDHQLVDDQKFIIEVLSDQTEIGSLPQSYQAESLVVKSNRNRKVGVGKLFRPEANCVQPGETCGSFHPCCGDYICDGYFSGSCYACKRRIKTPVGMMCAD